jgi:hypothetical protein
LDEVVGHSIAYHNRGKVDLDKSGSGRNRKLLVLGVDDVRDVRDIGAAITLGGEMERLSGVFGKAAEEEFHESVNILSSDRARVDSTAIFRVRESNVNGLVEEDDVCVGIPAVRVKSRVGALVSDVTRTKFEQKASGGATSWTAVEPHHKGRIFRRVA